MDRSALIIIRGPARLAHGKKHHPTNKLYVVMDGCFKKNLNASRPSEHPPVRGKKMSNRLLIVLLELFYSNSAQTLIAIILIHGAAKQSPYLVPVLFIVVGNNPYLVPVLFIVVGNNPYLVPVLFIVVGNNPYLVPVSFIVVGNNPFPTVVYVIFAQDELAFLPTLTAGDSRRSELKWPQILGNHF